MLIFSESCRLLCPQADQVQYRKFKETPADAASSVRYGFADGCIITKYETEKEVSFEYPVAFECIFDAEKALDEIEKYCTANFIPIVFSFVDADKLARLKKRYPRYDVNICETDGGEKLYSFRALSETFGIENDICLRIDGAVLMPLADCDAEAYCRLCRNSYSEEFWHCDCRTTEPFSDAKYFLECVRRERKEGISFGFAIKKDGFLVGEAVFYGFNCRGEAGVGLRFCESDAETALGKQVLSAMLNFAFEKLKLNEVFAQCDKKDWRFSEICNCFMIVDRETAETVRFVKKFQ